LLSGVPSALTRHGLAKPLPRRCHGTAFRGSKRLLSPLSERAAACARSCGERGSALPAMPGNTL